MEMVLPQAIEPVIRLANYLDVIDQSCWGPRRIADFELIFIVSGVFEYAEDGRVWTLGGNDILCIPPNRRHRFSHVREKGLISCIHFDLLENATANSNAYYPDPMPQILTRPANPDFYHHLFREIHLSFESVRQDERYINRALFKCLWAKLSQCWDSQQRQGTSQTIEAITQFIRDNLSRRVDRQTLAERFGYTPEHINYLFKKELGTTPSRFINHEKMLLAFEMLSNRRMSIKEVARALCFYDPYHFSRTFKTIIGYPPSHLRH